MTCPDCGWLRTLAGLCDTPACVKLREQIALNVNLAQRLAACSHCLGRADERKRAAVAAEREAIAKMVDYEPDEEGGFDSADAFVFGILAAEIRARGESESAELLAKLEAE